MDDKEKRLAKLSGLETLTDAEMQELVRLRPPGAFKTGPNLLTLGVVNLEQAFLNYKEGAARSKHAYDSGCFIEVISLRLQHIDFWLRCFWVARTNRVRPRQNNLYFNRLNILSVTSLVTGRRRA